MANINKIKLSGTTYSIQDLNATKTVELTQAQYDALVDKDPNTFYIITDAESGDLSNYYTKTEANALLASKADTSAFTAHTADTTVHVTSTEKTTWNGAVTKSNTNETALGGLKLVSLTQAQYDALATKDSSTVYFING